LFFIFFKERQAKDLQEMTFLSTSVK